MFFSVEFATSKTQGPMRHYVFFFIVGIMGIVVAVLSCCRQEPSGCIRSSGSRNSKDLGAVLGNLFEGRDDGGILIHLDHSSKRSLAYWHTRAQNAHALLRSGQSGGAAVGMQTPLKFLSHHVPASLNELFA
ncbi:uncharacterized protein LOC102471680 [Tupaia chinensis]|uniref:uncharacterized protein LOC102471680 n=1 Tax=Tupaia chinensis TaxID=246437 RepID=UPI000FFB5633|nr:uncharacterized protein LOC102471680 [Tupaia chinensis]